jgi:isopenicillin-N N-acyltransferase-like protein
MREIPVLRLAGSPTERGHQHGQAVAAGILELYDSLVADFRKTDPPVEERDLLAYAMSHLPESRAYAPDLVEEVDATAEAAGVPFEKVWLLNCFDEVSGYGLYRKLNAGHSCTTFAATGLSTADGKTFVGQSWDAFDAWEPMVLDIAPGGGEIGALIVSHPGIVAGTGINSAGVAVAWNTLRSLDARSGVPCTFLVRKALQQTTLGAAVQVAVSGVRAAGFNFIIGAEFAAVNVEATATRENVRYIGRHFGHANHYQEPELVQFEGSPASRVASTSRIRSGRINQLLDQAAGHIDLETCKTMLRDHADYPGSICAHKDPPRSEVLTMATMVYQPDQRLMLVTDKQACENPFQEFRVGHAVGAFA